MKFSKCHFFSKEIQYLGHILSTKGIQPLPSKTQAIQSMHPSKMPKQVHAFLGLLGYYRKFIKKFAKIAKPLTLLTCQHMKFNWTPTHHEAFLKLKESIIQAPILCYSNPNKRYIVYTNASDDTFGAVISRAWWYRITYCLPCIHFGDTKKLEHHGIRSIWSLLCHYQMELSSPDSRHYCTKWSQNSQQISYWEKCK